MASKTHLRRCHVCGECTEAQQHLVDQCQHCGKHLAPFYYFNEKLAMNLISVEEANMEYRSSALPHREYPPVIGLTVYWENER